MAATVASQGTENFPERQIERPDQCSQVPAARGAPVGQILLVAPGESREACTMVGQALSAEEIGQGGRTDILNLQRFDLRRVLSGGLVDHKPIV